MTCIKDQWTNYYKFSRPPEYKQADLRACFVYWICDMFFERLGRFLLTLSLLRQLGVEKFPSVLIIDSF